MSRGNSQLLLGGRADASITLGCVLISGCQASTSGNFLRPSPSAAPDTVCSWYLQTDVTADQARMAQRANGTPVRSRGPTCAQGDTKGHCAFATGAAQAGRQETHESGEALAIHTMEKESRCELLCENNGDFTCVHGGREGAYLANWRCFSAFKSASRSASSCAAASTATFQVASSFGRSSHSTSQRAAACDRRPKVHQRADCG